MTDPTTRVRAILDAATAGEWGVGFDDGSGPTYIVVKPSGDSEQVVVSGANDSYGIPQGVTEPDNARAIVLSRNLLPAALDVVEAARATSDELDELLDPENAPAVHGLWHPARRAMGEKSVELIDDDGCSLWVDPWEVAALVNGAVRYRAALDAFHAKMKETL